MPKIDSKFIDSCTKAGVGVIMCLGFLGFGYLMLTHQWEVDERQEQSDAKQEASDLLLIGLMARQTAALETLTRTYTGN